MITVCGHWNMCQEKQNRMGLLPGVYSLLGKTKIRRIKGKKGLKGRNSMDNEWEYLEY